MNAALAEINESHISIRGAAKKYGIPRGTIQDRIHNRIENGAKLGRPTNLAAVDEQKLVDYASNRASMGIGFTRDAFRKYAASLAKKRNKSFRGKGNCPSLKWWRLMRRRHSDLTLRKPEGTASVRHQCMNPGYVASYFESLRSAMEKNGLLCEPECIWNMDETGCSLSHTPGKVCAKTGSRYIQSRVSGNRETITLLCAGNAAGDVLPPHIIIKGKTAKSLNSLATNDAPKGSKFSVSDSGWTKQGLALIWFKEHFIPNIGMKRPQILIMDGHNSHNFVELIQAAIDSNIILVELPEHTSHWLQPSDRAVFGPFKKAYNRECNMLM